MAEKIGRLAWAEAQRQADRMSGPDREAQRLHQWITIAAGIAGAGAVGHKAADAALAEAREAAIDQAKRGILMVRNRQGRPPETMRVVDVLALLEEAKQ